MLDLTRLQCVKPRPGKVIAACPACREAGGDKAGEHLAIFDSGAFHCAVDSSEAHRRRIWELAGNRDLDRPAPPPIARRPMPAKPPDRPAATKPRLPPLRPLNVTEMARIAEIRRWPTFAGLELLTQRGLLWFGRVWDGGAEHDAWIVTDSTRLNAQARRLDGRPWQGIGGAKAKTLQGSQASWPVGLPESIPYPHIMLVEGGPDFLAALLSAWWGGHAGAIAPVMISGTGHTIPAAALPYFAGKPVTICTHADADPAKGQAASQRWADQLREAGAASVQFAAFARTRTEDGTPSPCKDLADYAATLHMPEPDAPDADTGAAPP